MTLKDSRFVLWLTQHPPPVGVARWGFSRTKDCKKYRNKNVRNAQRHLWFEQFLPGGFKLLETTWENRVKGIKCLAEDFELYNFALLPRPCWIQVAPGSWLRNELRNLGNTDPRPLNRMARTRINDVSRQAQYLLWTLTTIGSHIVHFPEGCGYRIRCFRPATSSGHWA